MFVDIRKVGYLVDKLKYNFILFIHYIFLMLNVILSSGLLINKYSLGPTLLESKSS